MPWVHDPATGEWVLEDGPTAAEIGETLPTPRWGPATAGEWSGPPLTPGPVWEPPQGAGPGPESYAPDDPVTGGSWSEYPPTDGGGYTEPNIGYLPDTPRPAPNEYPPDDGGGISFSPGEWGAPMNPGPMASPYDNIDHAKIAAWEDAARARGNEVRYTVSGTFEVDADGRIVSTMPSPYRMD